MLGLPIDVWAMMLFSIIVFFGVSVWALVYTLREEERKLDILETEGALDTYSPNALQDLRTWIRAQPDTSSQEVQDAQAAYRDCVETLQTTRRHFYDWSDQEIDRLDAL